jgi:hypothetical protein
VGRDRRGCVSPSSARAASRVSRPPPRLRG